LFLNFPKINSSFTEKKLLKKEPFLNFRLGFSFHEIMIELFLLGNLKWLTLKKLTNDEKLHDNTVQGFLILFSRRKNSLQNITLFQTPLR